MEKFSRLKPENTIKSKKDNILFDNEYVKIIEYENWSIIKESDLIVCIPYFIESNEFLIRNEYIPTYKYTDNQEYHVTVLSGTIDSNESVNQCLTRELEEEAGIVLNRDYNIEDLKPLFISKGHVNKYHPFIIPLTERDYHEVIASGDGSDAEKLSKSVKVSAKYIDSLQTSDVITEYMLFKLKEYLNVQI